MTSLYLIPLSGVTLTFFGFLYTKLYPQKFQMYREIYDNVSFSTLIDFCKFKCRNFLTQHLESGLVVESPKFYDITYFDGSLKYTARIPKKRGPRSFIKVESGETDVTRAIEIFAGSSHNFHGIKTTPSLLGYENLTFTFRNNSVKTFAKDEIIEL